MPRPAGPRTSRHTLLWMIREVERAFAGDEEGNATIRKACQDLKQFVDREWTEQREKDLVERERKRWEDIRQEAINMLGQSRWSDLETNGEEIRVNLETGFERLEQCFFEIEESSEVWQVLTDRLRRHAAKSAGQENLLKSSGDIRTKLVKFYEDLKDQDGILADIMRGELTASVLCMWLATQVAKSVGHDMPTDPKEQAKMSALGALVRFRSADDAKAQDLSPTGLLVRASDCAPFCALESKKFESAMCDTPGAKHYLELLFNKLTEFLTEERLNQLHIYMGQLDTAGLHDNKAFKEVLEHLQAKNWSKAAHVGKGLLVNSSVHLLPELDLPPIEGVRDGVQYSATNLDLTGFEIDESNVRLMINDTMGQITAGDPILRVVLDDISTEIDDLSWTFKQEYFPFMTGQGKARAEVKNVCILLSFQLVKRQKSAVHAIVATTTGDSNDGTEAASEASGNETPPTDDEEVPQLILSTCRVTIEAVKLELKGSSFASMLTDIFSKTIRTYIASLIQDMMMETITGYLEQSNEMFSNHAWDVLNSALQMDVHKLPTEEEASKHLAKLDTPSGTRKDLYSVTFTKEGPIGISLGKWNEYVAVKAFKRAKNGSILPGEASGKIKVGDVLVGFNGGDITSLPLDRVTTRISRSRRPLTLSFAPGMADSPEGSKKRTHVAKFTFKEDKLLLLIKQRPIEDRAALVTGFRAAEGGAKGPGEKAGVPIGWCLAGINDQSMLTKSFKETMQVFAATTKRPVELQFVRNPDVVLEINEPVIDLKIASMDGKVIVSGFSQLRSPAEMVLGDTVQSGDYICGVGSTDVGNLKFDDVISVLRNTPRPMEIRFSRANANGAITAAGNFMPGPLGMIFYKSSVEGKCSFKAFQGVEGPVERTKQVVVGSLLTAINGTAVLSEDQARALLQKPALPIKLMFRDMEAYLAGGWDRT